MFVAILKATNSSFQKGMKFCHSIYEKKVMKLLAFIFEHLSYIPLYEVWVSFLHKHKSLYCKFGNFASILFSRIALEDMFA